MDSAKLRAPKNGLIFFFIPQLDMLKLALKAKKALKLKKFYDNILLAFQNIHKY